ncbi:MAG: site-2 protease family protein [Candidatus Micrarchaeota archaeon]|nr:site-2 protease family protein [Candidatus Micrarchaeota archaeon]
MTGGGNAKYKAVAILAVAIAAMYLVYLSHQIGLVFQAIAAFVILLVSGIGMQRSMGFKGGYGLILMGGKTGISTIERLSKSKGSFWEKFAMWGLTLGLGIAAYPLVKGRMKKSTYLLGLATLVLTEVFVIPYVAYGLQFIRLPGISITATQFTLPDLSIYLRPFELVQLSVTTIFGYAGSAMFSILYNSASILYSFAGYLANPTPAGAAASGITSQIPGVAPVIPGITMPLIAGILSLAILLVVHEFSHGVLARRAKIKIKQVGVLLYGFIPIGGFVEPDERQVVKAKKEVQTNIFSAGIAANFLFMLIFFALTIILVVFIAPRAYSYGVVILSTSPGYPAHGLIPNGTVVKAWNGHAVSNLSSLEAAAASDAPNSLVTVTAGNGTVYSMTALADPSNHSRGLIGVSLGYKPILDTPAAQLAYFLFTLFSLSMLLNFLVAVVNMLPIPGFDGWRIYMSNIKSTRLVNTLGALVIILIVVNIIPWFFYL